MRRKPEDRPRSRLLALADVAAVYGVTTETVRLWVTRGVRCGGAVRKLEARWVAGRWLTRRRWVREFIAAVSDSRSRRNVPSAVAEREAAAKRLGGSNHA